MILSVTCVFLAQWYHLCVLHMREQVQIRQYFQFYMFVTGFAEFCENI